MTIEQPLNKNKVAVYATGLNPISHEGEAYKSELDTWFSVWLFTITVCEDLLSLAETNVGFFPKQLDSVISEENAISIAKRLHIAIEKGEAQEYANMMKGQLEEYLDMNLELETVDFSIENVRNFAHFCGLSGGFTLS